MVDVFLICTFVEVSPVKHIVTLTMHKKHVYFGTSILFGLIFIKCEIFSVALIFLCRKKRRFIFENCAIQLGLVIRTSGGKKMHLI